MRPGRGLKPRSATGVYLYISPIQDRCGEVGRKMPHGNNGTVEGGSRFQNISFQIPVLQGGW